MKVSRIIRSSNVLVAAWSLGGCTSISIAPSCPNELQVDESGLVLANEDNPGAIAKYFWEVIPSEVGQVTDPTKPTTTFIAASEGEAVIRLTASDGLYQVTAQCQTRVVGIVVPPTEDSGNVNDNDSTNDNSSDNADEVKDDNDNGADTGGGRPPRTGRRDHIPPP